MHVHCMLDKYKEKLAILQSSIRGFEKNIHDPYYEPTIVVHDSHEEVTTVLTFI